MRRTIIMKKRLLKRSYGIRNGTFSLQHAEEQRQRQPQQRHLLSPKRRQPQLIHPQQRRQRQQGGTLIVGFDQDFPPMGFVGDDGEYTGFDLDLCKGSCKTSWLRVQRHSRSPGTPAIWSLSPEISTASGTDLRSQAVRMITWTEPYMANKQVFIVAKRF